MPREALRCPTAEDTRRWGARLAGVLARRRPRRADRRARRRQDDADPGASAEGLGVRGPITSPTFVIARVHPSPGRRARPGPRRRLPARRRRRARRPRPRRLARRRRSPSSSGGTGWPRGSPRTASRSPCSGDPDARRAGVVRPRWSAGPRPAAAAALDAPGFVSLTPCCCSRSTPRPPPSPSPSTTARRCWPSPATVDARRHGELLAPAIVAVLPEAGRSRGRRDRRRRRDRARAVHRAAGRAGHGAARSPSPAASPCTALCSLDALAHQAWREGAVAAGQSLVVATDARRKEVYWARYEVTAEGAVAAHRARRCRRPAALAAAAATAHPWSGAGGLLYPDAAARAGRAARRRRAATWPTWPCGGRPPATTSAGIEPLYLRRPDAVPTAERRQPVPLMLRPPARGGTSRPWPRSSASCSPPTPGPRPSWWSELAGSARAATTSCAEHGRRGRRLRRPRPRPARSPTS